MIENNKNLGRILNERRVNALLTLRDLSRKTGVSKSYLARIERGERFPSPRILRKIARPLGFSEHELLTLAGYLAANLGESFSDKQLDPYAAAVLSQHPVEIQRTVVAILSIVTNMAKSIAQKNSTGDTDPPP